jgi:thiamine-phosphate pyrophosphorylase
VSRAPQTPDPTEAGCRLFLISPPRLVATAFAERLEAALSVGGVAGFLLRLEAGEPSSLNDAAARLRAVCAARAVAFLVQAEVERALELAADGVHLVDVRAVAPARAMLGRERLLGVSCGASRHLAMVAGEAGADYIAFGDPGRPPDTEVVELIRWWSELFVLPCLAESYNDAATCGLLARAGADFVGVSRSVWEHPDGAAAGVTAMRRAIAGPW